MAEITLDRLQAKLKTIPPEKHEAYKASLQKRGYTWTESSTAPTATAAPRTRVEEMIRTLEEGTLGREMPDQILGGIASGGRKLNSAVQSGLGSGVEKIGKTFGETAGNVAAVPAAAVGAVSEFAIPQDRLGVALTAAGPLSALGGKTATKALALSKSLPYKKPGFWDKVKGSILSSKTALQPKYANAIAADPSIMGAGTVDKKTVGGLYNELYSKLGIKTDSSAYKKLFGSAYPATERQTGKLRSMVENAIEKLSPDYAGPALSTEEAVFARQAARKLGESSAAKLDARVASVAKGHYDVLDKTLSDRGLESLKKLDALYFRASAKEAASEIIPMNRNQSPNALRTNLMAMLAGSSVKNAASGQFTRAAVDALQAVTMSPKALASGMSTRLSDLSRKGKAGAASIFQYGARQSGDDSEESQPVTPSAPTPSYPKQSSMRGLTPEEEKKFAARDNGAIGEDPNNLRRILRDNLPEKAYDSVSRLGDVARTLEELGATPEGVDRTPLNLAQMVFHGTPHTFAEEVGNLFGRFKKEKIGSGQGAQSFGWGHYVAENPTVAKDYHKMLGGQGSRADLPYEQLQSHFTPGKLTPGYGGVDRVVAFHPETGNTPWYVEVQGVKKVNGEWVPKTGIDGRIRAHATVPNMGEIAKLEGKTLGNVYKADLPDESVGGMLNWDKPLSEQPYIVEKLGKYASLDLDMKKTTGKDLYNRLVENKGGKEAASKHLDSLGIPGIKYLDEGSRDAGKGTHNFVVFNDETLKILGKENPLK